MALPDLLPDLDVPDHELDDDEDEPEEETLVHYWPSDPLGGWAWALADAESENEGAA